MAPELLIIDNYDSFTYNLVHLCHQAMKIAIGDCGDIAVYRNDSITLSEIEAHAPKAILISPGPGTPDESGITLDVIRTFQGKIPIFGVCLGMQAIAQCFGAQVSRGIPVHGKTSLIRVDTGHPLFANVPEHFEVVRYHSLHVPQHSLANTKLSAIAWSDGDQVLMALIAKTHPVVWGVQFHPESIGSRFGLQLMLNFYKTALTGEKEPILNSASSPFSRL